jgi:hypothetical protein
LIPFVKEVKYLGAIFDSGVTWRQHIDSIVTKTLRTFIRIYSLLKSERLSAKSKLTLYKTLMRSKMTYACLAWEFAADSSACKIESSAPLVAYQGAHRFALYIRHSRFSTFNDYITKICRKQAQVIQTHYNVIVRNTKGLNLVTVRHRIVQVSKLP